MSLAIVQNIRRPENAAGPFFVDDKCISCGACWRLAPELLASHPVHTFAFFQRQPTQAQEEKLALAAVEICPVSAIHREPECQAILW